MDTDKTYPLAIIGAGPAGLSASIYASRYGVDHIVIGHLAGGHLKELRVGLPGARHEVRSEAGGSWGEA